MFQLLKIVIPFFILFFSFSTVSSAQKIAIGNYENKAQGYAILSAQYSKDAYFFSRKNYFIGNTQAIKKNCDSAIVFAQIAMEYADSAFKVASDMSEYAKTIMLYAKDYQQKAIKSFKQIRSSTNGNFIHELSGKSMYAMGNAVADAYKASLAFEFSPEVDDRTRRGGAMYSSERSEHKPKTTAKESSRDITRLESDEFSYMTIKELYGVRLVEIDDELIQLNNEAKVSSGKKLTEIQNAIAQLKLEEKKCFQKMRNSEDRLISVKTDLSEEMLKVVNKDIFTTEKEGFYDANIPVPVDFKMPEGLVYRVQIGFFKSQLPPQHFKGIFPLSSQKVDKVYFRYVAGNFAKYEDVKSAKMAIVAKGYSDSFVVAYFNGKKVSISEALKKEKENN